MVQDLTHLTSFTNTKSWGKRLYNLVSDPYNMAFIKPVTSGSYNDCYECTPVPH
jgi:hypothetical protein